MFLVIDTETTGKPLNYKAPVEDLTNWPRVVQLAWILFDDSGAELSAAVRIVKPDGWTIPDEAAAIHGISTEKALAEGILIGQVLREMKDVLALTQFLVAHNLDFDRPVAGAEFLRLDNTNPLAALTGFCTMQHGTNVCKLPGRYGFKWPKLNELHQHLFQAVPEVLHDAMADARSCGRCFFEMRKLGHIKVETTAVAQAS